MLAKILLFLILLQAIVFGAEYAVITKKDATIGTLSPTEIKNIFIMKKHFFKTTKLVPVNMPSSTKIRNYFETRVLHTNRHKLNHYWVKKHFQGIRPPVVQSSVLAMKLFVKNVTGAIGYIPLSELDADLKVIYEF